MTKTTFCFFYCFLLTMGSLAFFSLNPSVVIHAEQPIPEYAKWSRLAMQKTKEHYPKAAIIDYLHVGKEQTGSFAVEKFKLWLRSGEQEFGVFVNIEYNPKTEEVMRITFKETFH